MLAPQANLLVSGFVELTKIDPYHGACFNVVLFRTTFFWVRLRLRLWLGVREKVKVRPPITTSLSVNHHFSRSMFWDFVLSGFTRKYFLGRSLGGSSTMATSPFKRQYS